jgi:hypothetical protein
MEMMKVSTRQILGNVAVSAIFVLSEILKMLQQAE